MLAGWTSRASRQRYLERARSAIGSAHGADRAGRARSLGRRPAPRAPSWRAGGSTRQRRAIESCCRTLTTSLEVDRDDGGPGCGTSRSALRRSSATASTRSLAGRPRGPRVLARAAGAVARARACRRSPTVGCSAASSPSCFRTCRWRCRPCRRRRPTTAESLARLRTDQRQRRPARDACPAPRTRAPIAADPPRPPGQRRPRTAGQRRALAASMLTRRAGAALAALPRRRIGPRRAHAPDRAASSLCSRRGSTAWRRFRDRALRPRAAGPARHRRRRARRGSILAARRPIRSSSSRSTRCRSCCRVSLLEGFEEVQRQSARRYGRRPLHVVVGSYSVDEVQNEFLARCRAAGRRFAFSQHGGMYLQSPVNAQERLELGPESVFWSWGADEDRVVPTPNPYLERLRDSYRGGTRITIVEALEPPDAYVVRFAGHPLANQGYEIGADACGARALAVRRRAGSSSAQALSEPGRLAGTADVVSRRCRRRSRGGAAAWMAASRLAVIPYLDTAIHRGDGDRDADDRTVESAALAAAGRTRAAVRPPTSGRDLPLRCRVRGGADRRRLRRRRSVVGDAAPSGRAREFHRAVCGAGCAALAALDRRGCASSAR